MGQVDQVAWYGFRLQEAFGIPESEGFRYPIPPITVGAITRMIALRKAIAGGTAMPSEIAEFEREGSAREKALHDAIDITVEALLKVRRELGSVNPRCNKGGRHHIPPWLACLPLNKEADALLPMDQGEVQCRAGFFDLSLDGRWGGVITGDRIEVDFNPCECGAGTPSIRDNIERHVDIEGDDKIGCAGTVDAYVRGFS